MSDFARLAAMRTWLRGGFYFGLSIALFVGLFLIWLWQSERQVNRHTENLFHTIEKKNWSGFADFIAPDYTDQWGDDRSLVLQRMREVFRYVRIVRVNFVNPNVKVYNSGGTWRGKITIDGDDGEVAALIKERVNPLTTPFELEWRRMSGRPWDWKLVRVTNLGLEIPASVE